MSLVPAKLPDGTLPAFTSVGSYPLVYLTVKDTVLCAGCAAEETDEPLACADVHWEGEPLECEGDSDKCRGPIESAYGPVETQEPEAAT